MKNLELAQPMVRTERGNLTVLDFRGWRADGTLQLTPKFQRRSVWKTPAKAYLVDTILRGMPIPPIYLRLTQSADGTRVVREVVDGQQRLAAVLDFMDDKFAIPRGFDGQHAGKKFSALPKGQQDAIKEYSLICENLKGASDREVLEIFVRVNTYSVPLSEQELRGGEWFGQFRQACYALAHQYLEYWRINRLFSETGIARMAEVEFCGELLVMALAGMQDKKKSLSIFYKQLDDVFPDRDDVVKRVSNTLDVIQEAVGEELPKTEFTRTPLFYSLFAAVYHRRYGLANVAIPTPRRALTKDDRQQLRDAVLELSELVVKAKENDDNLTGSEETFVRATLRQTDNIQPRNARFEKIYSKAFP